MRAVAVALAALAVLASAACGKKSSASAKASQAAAEEIYRLEEPGLVPPEEIQRIAPHVPSNMRSHSFSGHFFVFEGVVDATGKVKDLETVQAPTITPPNPEIEAAFQTALLQWTYKPATLGGKPVSVYMSWSLDPNPAPAILRPTRGPGQIKPQWWIEK